MTSGIPWVRTTIVGVLAILGSAAADQDEQAMLVDGLQKHPELFGDIAIEKANEPADFNVALGKEVLKLENGDDFDGFRFKAPEGAGELDFVWYFNAPDGWSNWYLCPVKGTMGQSFRDWLLADKVYQKFDKANSTGRLRVLQTLGAGYFKGGEEYIMWFRRGEDSPNGSLDGRLTFTKPQDDWDYEAIEKALKLKPQELAAQVEVLGSMGGKILMDEAFFTNDYARNRIDSVFFSLRQIRRMQGGFFVTIEVSIPPCRTNPSYADILKKYGEPDFVLTSAEEARVHGVDEKDEDVTTYYFDYFGFQVENDDDRQTVVQVVTHANDYSDIKPDANGASFGQIDMKNLTVFHKDGKEVGRMYFFMEGEKLPVVVETPPEGRYKRDNQVMEYLGDGRWNWISYDDRNRVAREIPFTNHRMEGKAEGFYKSGKPRFIAHYKAGVLDGELIQYAEDGSIETRKHFREGQAIEP